jgi:hypothetical protein
VRTPLIDSTGLTPLPGPGPRPCLGDAGAGTAEVVGAGPTPDGPSR